MNNSQSASTDSAGSAHEFKLPDLGEGMHEAEIVQWLISPGDTINLDQNMVKVETDKAIVEIPSPIAGRVREIRVPDGQVAKVGDVLVVFDTSANGGASAPLKTEETTTPAPQPSNVQVPASPVQTQQPSSSQPAARPRVLAVPSVRKLAFELGIDLEQVTPSNPNGHISLEDVRAYAERAKTASPPPQLSAPTQNVEAQFIAPEAEERQPLTGLRKRIAEHMERSWRTVPHATAFDEVDGGALMALRQALLPAAEQRGVHLTYIPLLVKLLIPVLKEFAIFNASLDEEKREIIIKHTYNIGIATASPEGLLVPVLRNADQLTLLEIAKRLEQLIEGARKRTLSLQELSGSTFTLNNVGSFGGGSGTPIINYPEVAILAIGKLQEKAIVRQGEIIARPMMPLALSFDHRLIDGAMAGAFLGRFKELVENPQQLMLDMV